jgi:hypothetical protein
MNSSLRNNHCGKRPVYVSQGFGISLERTIEKISQMGNPQKCARTFMPWPSVLKRKISKGDKFHG